MTFKRLSVVIPNYNYERFVARAIESALALDWPDVDVVVVDDGSTDESLKTIRRYEDRVTVLATSNATQRVAANLGFEQAEGDVVIFLDSDDVLPSDLPNHLARVWTPSISKAQFLMQRIDENDRRLGAPFPRYGTAASSADIRRWLIKTSAYPTPPGSGNAYSRWFLERMMPVDGSVGDFIDSALLVAAPLMGTVVTVPEVVVGYRRHPANDSRLLADPRRFAREIERARARWDLARRLPTGLNLGRAPLFRSRELLQLRVAAARLDPTAEVLPGDNKLRLVTDAVLSPMRPGPEPMIVRLLIASWCLAAAIGPRALAERIVRRRYQRS